MACNCGSNKTAPKTFVVTEPGGVQKTYKTEVEAIAAAKRTGGTYRAV